MALERQLRGEQAQVPRAGDVRVQEEDAAPQRPADVEVGPVPGAVDLLVREAGPVFQHPRGRVGPLRGHMGPQVRGCGVVWLVRLDVLPVICAPDDLEDDLAALWDEVGWAARIRRRRRRGNCF